MRRRWSLMLGAAVLLMTGCVTEEETVTEDKDIWYACETASDCTLVEVGCCDHCNGGELVSVNAAYASEASDALRDTCSEPVACTERACEPKQPTCEANRCGFTAQTLDGCSSLDEAACEASTECRPIRGAKAAEICAENYDNWMTIYSGCMEAELGCGDAETCAINPATGERLVFPDTCTPQGWSGCEACTTSGSCSDGTAAENSQLCVADDNGQLRFTVTPGGCHSSSCTITYDAACTVGALEGSSYALDALICLGDDPGMQTCTADCGGGGSATCYAAAPPDGAYTATLGDLTLEFTLPLTDSVCVGSPF